MESISSAPEMTEINVDSLPGIICVYLDVIFPTDVILATLTPNNKHGTKITKAGKSGGNIKNPESGIIRRSSVPRTGKTIASETPLNPFPAYVCDFPCLEPKEVHITRRLV